MKKIILVSLLTVAVLSSCDDAKIVHTSTDITYLGLAGQMSLEGDAEAILQANILYKKGSHSLLSGIKKGCRVTKSRYNRSSSVTPKSKSIYKKLKPICDQYI
jgi:hypothetical protein